MVEQKIISDITQIINSQEKIFSRDLVESLNEARTVPLTQKALANILNGEGIFSKKLRINGKQGKGYRLEQFTTVPASNDATVPDDIEPYHLTTVPLKKVTEKIAATVPLNNGQRYAYRYELNNGDCGTWLTTVPPKEAKSALMARFLGRKIKFIKQTN